MNSSFFTHEGLKFTNQKCGKSRENPSAHASIELSDVGDQNKGMVNTKLCFFGLWHPRGGVLKFVRERFLEGKSICVMDILLDDVVQEDDFEIPKDFSDFLEFTNRLNIPLNEDYFSQLQARRVRESKTTLGPSLTVFEQGIKNGRHFSSEYQNERRLQNALWRVWWRQTRARFHATVKEIPEGEDIVGDVVPEVRTIDVRGEDIGDFPTEYTISAPRPYEIPVVGTYIDKKIVPGFAYRVRRNGTSDFLFNGEALVLKSIGRGYGKRLTFHSDAVENDNFFWSDSNPDEGFAFSIQVIYEGNEFDVLDRHGRKVAETRLITVSDEQEINDVLLQKREIDMVVSVEMECSLKFLSLDHVPEHLRDQIVDLTTSGAALSRKTLSSWKAETVEIRNVHIRDIGACSFYSSA